MATVLTIQIIVARVLVDVVHALAGWLPLIAEILGAVFASGEVYELAHALPAGARLLGDKGYISAPDATAIWEMCDARVITQPRANMPPCNQRNFLSSTG